MKIKRIAVRKGRCEISIGGKDYSFPFRDLAEFSDGVQDVLGESERLVPTNALRPTDKTFMQLESLQVQDAAEHNRNLYSAREVRDRRAEGQNIAGGDWYMEVSINGSDTDCSFNTVAELFQIVQQIIARELAASGQVVSRAPGLLVAHG